MALGRLSDWVRLHGVATFTFDDFLFVGSKVSTDPDRIVLVGGQAIETWGVLLDVPAPTGDKHPLTEDTDWLASKRDAQWLCQLLGPGVELQFPNEQDTGPSTALAFLRRPDGRVVMMDFLRAIVGPSEVQVRRLAVPIEVQGVRLNVLHPLLCLESRLANIAVLSSKRNGNGLLQAEWAIRIAEAYVRRVLKETGVRAATRACHEIVRIAASDYARYCLSEYGIDPVKAVTPTLVQEIGVKFEAEDWPVKLAWIRKRQARWLRIRARKPKEAAHPISDTVPHKG